MRAFLPEVEAASGSPDLLTKEVARYGDEIIGGIARSDCFDFNDTKLDDAIGGLY